MEGINIRQFQENDQREVWNLHIAGLKQTDSFIGDPEARKHLDSDLNDIQQEYLCNRGDFLVASNGQKIIGMGALRKVDNDTAEIKRMRVDAEFQGKGVGGIILDKLIVSAKALGYMNLVLDTSIKQVPAQKLYQSRGFNEYKRGKIYNQETIYYQREIKK
jgi:ribosomal protein S18 acetylase RimI-like enzyme